MDKRLMPLAAVTLGALVGCAATPVGQLPADELVWEERVVLVDYETAYRNLREGFRKCGARYGLPDPDLDPTARSARFDMYLQGGYGGRSDFVLGVIKIQAKGERSSAIQAGVQKVYDKPAFGPEGGTRSGWFDLANGDYSRCG